MMTATRQRLQRKPLLLQIFLENVIIEQENKHRLLGIIIDKNLGWQHHSDSLCRTIAHNLFLLSKLKLYTDSQTRLLFYNAKVHSQIDYASTAWDGCNTGGLPKSYTLFQHLPQMRSQRNSICSAYNNTSSTTKPLSCTKYGGKWLQVIFLNFSSVRNLPTGKKENCSFSLNQE